jgi:hypothetical protein
MRPAFLHYLAQARISDLYRHAQRAAPAVAAGQAQCPPSQNRAPTRWPLAHRNLDGRRSR